MQDHDMMGALSADFQCSPAVGTDAAIKPQDLGTSRWQRMI
jgi:hypothetical protein